jgi:type II secretory pathway predicted ATPase ExeA
VKHPPQVDERDRIQRAATQRMTSPGYAYRARQRPAEMLQSVACLVGAGKTVSVRTALAALDATRHTVIYLPNPQVGVRGIHEAIITAFGANPTNLSSRLITQAAGTLAAERDERGRTPVLVLDFTDRPVRRPPRPASLLLAT